MATAAASAALKRRVVVFGGNGFVGTRVCSMAVKFGASDVASVSRSGSPPASHNPNPAVTWAKGDAFDPSTYEELLTPRGEEEEVGVVSCIGAFGSTDFMRRVCGEATKTIAEVAAERGVRNFAFVSAAGTGEKLPPFLGGYYEGKKIAEDAVMSLFPENGICLRPGGISGDRRVGENIVLPLGLVMGPLGALLRLPFPAPQLRNVLGPAGEALFTPPIPVDAVGAVAAKGALGKVAGGIYTEADIRKLAEE